ncbi:MAG: hypothetical protein VX619_09350 [bacterium]|nr:hypothetical protein [bacterium]
MVCSDISQTLTSPPLLTKFIEVSFLPDWNSANRVRFLSINVCRDLFQRLVNLIKKYHENFDIFLVNILISKTGIESLKYFQKVSYLTKELEALIIKNPDS